MRGNSFTSFCAALGLGSSPRVRGKRHKAREANQPTGLIPARAGKTRAVKRSRSASTAHPRVYGENSDSPSTSLWRYGSSPRVRGKQNTGNNNVSSVGLIPACTGKTVILLACLVTNWAHPRVCGENLTFQNTPELVPGSSPRVRGKLTDAHEGDIEAGLIPACAGKTLRPLVIQRRAAAHPRVCGENRLTWRRGSKRQGSSPRVRGKRRNYTSGSFTRGLIPACAGKTVEAAA